MKLAVLLPFCGISSVWWARAYAVVGQCLAAPGTGGLGTGGVRRVTGQPGGLWGGTGSCDGHGAWGEALASCLEELCLAFRKGTSKASGGSEMLPSAQA